MNVLITGGGQGIGFELVKSFLKRGSSVYMTSRVTEPTEKIAELEKLGRENKSNLIYSPMDVSDRASIDQLASEIDEELDIILNNAGILGDWDRQSNILSFDDEEWERNMRVNAWGPAAVFRAFYPKLKKGGSLVTITSDAGSILHSGTGSAVYGVSKAAANKLMSILKATCPDERVLSIHPGWVKTDQMARGNGTITQEESAEAIAALLLNPAFPQNNHFYFDYLGNEMDY